MAVISHIFPLLAEPFGKARNVFFCETVWNHFAFDQTTTVFLQGIRSLFKLEFESLGNSDSIYY